ncbi:hypothetical protein MNV49_001449 [Pseudohyphozyma bogoriensis]|nr:hypothetical protein MNV49_001449 [Pseudohyphozyma bogoriensis]
MATTAATRTLSKALRRPAPLVRLAAPSRSAAFSLLHHQQPQLSSFARRSFVTSRPACDQLKPGSAAAEELTEQQYHLVSDTAMDRLTECLEDFVEHADQDGWEVEYASGVLTLKLGEENGTYVINKQPPNKQIWLSSPISGPKRYDYDTTYKQWFYAREGTLLRDLLRDELRKITGDQGVEIELGEGEEA